MKILLGMIMVLTVAGEDTTFSGVEGDSVLLPCTCSDRNLDKEVKWQMESPNATLVLKYDNTTSTSYDRYKGRVKMFLHEDSYNCSILLTNITAEDHGKYRCRFHIQGILKKQFVNLNISVSYNVCQNESNLNDSQKVFECAVVGRYREVEVQWNLDGQILTNSHITHLNTTETLDAHTGLFHVTSSLQTMKLNGTSKPVCEVKAKDRSTFTFRSDCKTETGYIHSELKDLMRCRYSIIISIIMVLGFLLFMWLYRNSKIRKQSLTTFSAKHEI